MGLKESILPAEREVEALLLGVCISQPESTAAVLDQLTADDFYAEPHRRIFGAIATLAQAGEHVDYATVAAVLTLRKQLESVGGLTYLVELDSALPRIFDVDAYIRILRRKSILRQAAMRANLLAESICAGTADVGEVEEAQKWLESLASRAHSAQDGLRGLGEYVDAAGGFERILGQSDAKSVPTPWPMLNNSLSSGGFTAGQLVIVAALPGKGKTLVGVLLALEAARLSHGAAVFSLEMESSEVWRRAITSLSEVRAGRLARGGLSEDQHRRVGIAAADLTAAPIWIDDTPTATVGSIVSRIERHRARGHDVRIAIIDYLTLLTVSGRSRQSRVEEVSEISRQLKLAAKRLKIPVVVMAQLNRDPAKDGSEPELHHLRASGSIEQDADTVLMIHQDPKDRAASMASGGPSPMTVLLRKQRSGPTGRFRMLFDFSGMRMTEI